MSCVESLLFDSQHFEKSVGALTFNNSSFIKASVEEISVFDLLYVFSAQKRPDINIEGFINSYQDEKVVFHKKVLNEKLKSPLLVFKECEFLTDNLCNLAIESGIFSRFFKDPRFSLNKAKDLYLIWLEKSISRELATHVFSNDSEDFLLTLKVEKGTARVGLFAVSFESRGKGIGKKVLNQLNSWCLENSISKIIIPTQRVNSVACNFYKACGYQELDSSFIYHFWKKDV